MPPVPLPTAPISDGTVSLRVWATTDAPSMRRVFLDPEMYRWTDADPDETEADFAGAIERGWGHREAGTRLCLAITDAQGVVGAIDLMMGEFERGELGYALGAWARGKGYATRAVRLLSDWSFAHAGVLRLELPIPVDHARSRAVAERAGYRYEGLLRSYLWLRDGGERQDVAMYARLSSDPPAA
jgi:RimJ/RimL family protein N-acetyltransferase